MSDRARAEKFEQIKARREEAAKKLVHMLPNYLYALEKDEQILDGDLEKIKKLKADLKNQWTLPTDLL